MYDILTFFPYISNTQLTLSISAIAFFSSFQLADAVEFCFIYFLSDHFTIGDASQLTLLKLFIFAKNN